jgi:Signal transduction histidine kinase
VIALLLVAGPAVILLAGAGGWFLAGRVLRPVARMTREAAAIGEDALDAHVEVPGTSDELHRLAETLNAMLDRVQRGVDQKRRFVADASHELRTPLAVMGTELDVRLLGGDIDPGSREVLVSAREEVERMGAIVENLLTLARLDEGGLAIASEPVDLMAIASEAVAALAPVLEAKPVEVGIEGTAAPTRGTPRASDRS